MHVGGAGRHERMVRVLADAGHGPTAGALPDALGGWSSAQAEAAQEALRGFADAAGDGPFDHGRAEALRAVAAAVGVDGAVPSEGLWVAQAEPGDGSGTRSLTPPGASRLVGAVLHAAVQAQTSAGAGGDGRALWLGRRTGAVEAVVYLRCGRVPVEITERALGALCFGLEGPGPLRAEIDNAVAALQAGAGRAATAGA